MEGKAITAEEMFDKAKDLLAELDAGLVEDSRLTTQEKFAVVQVTLQALQHRLALEQAEAQREAQRAAQLAAASMNLGRVGRG